MAQLLLELFSEEIPARMQGPAAEQLKTELDARLEALGYAGFDIRTFATPRRLAAVVEGLATRQLDTKEERKGPRVDAPERALSGFLSSVGLQKSDLQTQEDKKGAFYVAVIERKGRATVDVVAELVPALVREFKWPKSMRWGDGQLRWVRPLHSILCILDGKVVPFEIDGLKSGNTTRGHRFLAPKEIAITSFDDYEEKLSHGRVVLEEPQRHWLIEKGARDLVTSEGFELVADDGLMRENAGLVEWPVVLMGRIDDTFVKPLGAGGLPPEVLTSAMRKHQRYFSVRDPKTGGLAPRFVVVANLDAKDEGREIVAGNERVLRARLSDAKFFWDQDCKVPLAARVDKLGDIIFHAKLGTLRDKTAHIEKLAAHIAAMIGADAAKARRAAHLAKADLVTGVVGEFPDLQGVMGRYYALADGENAEVANAIAEHYAPAGASDTCPTSPVSVAVALADKIDTLVGFWLIEEKPTGSKDPYALRRAALGVIRTVLENKLRFRLISLFSEAEKINSPSGDVAEEKIARSLRTPGVLHLKFEAPGVVISKPGSGTSYDVNAVLINLLAFFADRLKVHLKDKGIKHDLIDAVFALPGQDDLVLIIERVNALKDFLDSDDGANLLTAYKRASNILKIEEKRDKAEYRGEADAKLFTEKQERVLHDAIAKVIPEAVTLAEKENFAGAMAALAKLRAPIDAFFDHVTVNTDDAKLRRNRLLLLSEIRTALESVADFSKIEG